jgi:hypothetical protein
MDEFLEIRLRVPDEYNTCLDAEQHLWKVVLRLCRPVDNIIIIFLIVHLGNLIVLVKLGIVIL